MSVRGPGGRGWLGVGVVVSVAAHVLLGAAVVSASWDAQRGWERPEGSPDEAARHEERVRLGLDRATPVTIDWLGIEVATPEHVAADVAQSQQAALAMEAAGGAPAEAAPVVEEAPVEAERAEPEAVAPPEGVEEAVEAFVGPPMVAVEGRPSEAEETTEERVEPAEAVVAAAAPAATPSQGRGEAVGPGEGADPGVPAEREADATALEQVLELRTWTTPVVGEGIELITVRPRWPTHFMGGRLTRPALVVITLRRGADGVGVVRKAEFASVEREDGSVDVLNSGDPAVDSIVLNTVYQWKAKGEQVESLGAEESLVVRLRLFTVR